jgi:predicted transposase YbfD/YdcC
MTHFAALPDPRIDRTKLHPFINILFIALCAVICGADSFTEMEDFGRVKRKWLSRYLDLTHGIPSHDTFARVLSRLDPEAFSACFAEWIKAWQKSVDGQVIAIDGKEVCGSVDSANSLDAITMISAWATRNNLIMGQVQTDRKSNEITAIPKLLKMLDINGCIVTIDAIGTQKSIASQIRGQHGEYVLAVKKNQSYLYDELERYFAHVTDPAYDCEEEIPCSDPYRTRNKDHGRIETREYYCALAPRWMAEVDGWTDLQSIAMVQSERIAGEKIETQRRYYISSLKPEPKKIAAAIRGHWRIENCLHWLLDVTFDEDRCRARKDNAAANFAILRHIALNLLKNEKTVNFSIQRKRFQAAMDDKYLLKILRAQI